MKSGSRLERILSGGQFAVTAECGPPRGADASIVRKKANILKGYVDACNVTDNQTAMVRMSSLAASVILIQEGLEPVMQMVCRDRNRIAMQSDILGAYALGIRNLLCLSGDHQSFGDHPGAKNVYDIDSMQLLDMARRMCEDGRFQGGNEIKSGKPELFLGAAANPFATPYAIRVPRLAKKSAAGANFIQTQCIYDLEHFEDWMKKVVERNIHKETAILAGITPLKSAGMAKYMATKVPGIEIPEHILERMANTPKEKQKEEGIAIAIESIERLKAMPGVSGIHIMAIGWEDIVPEIVERSGFLPRPQLD